MRTVADANKYFSEQAPWKLRESDPERMATIMHVALQLVDDGKTLLYLSSARDPKALDLYEYDVKKDKSGLVWKADEHFEFAGTSRDHKRFLAAVIHSDADNDLYLVDLATPTVKKPLTTHTGDVLFENVTFALATGEYRDVSPARCELDRIRQQIVQNETQF